MKVMFKCCIFLISLSILHVSCSENKQPIKTEGKNPVQEKETIDKLLNSWHQAAALSDEEVFFGSMTEDAIYLGTDISEKWLRDSLFAWSEEYWELESAWAFTPTEREVYLTDDMNYAWFDEKLETWMGPCRGSGVLLRSDSAGWKIKHYHLAIAVANDNVQDYLEIIQRKDSLAN